MDRRQFLASTAALSTLTYAGRLHAAPPSGAKFLLVFLRGGYDCANLLVPYSSSHYYESRPHIAIPRPSPADELGTLAIDGDWALAPAVRESMSGFLQRRELAFIPFAGTDDVSRSHFETQDTLELGQTSGAARDFRSGFLARLAGIVTGPSPIAFTDSLPLVFHGGRDVPNISLKSVGKPVFDARQTEILESMYAGHHLKSAVTDGLDLRQEVAKTMDEEMTSANRGAITTKGFELEAARVGRLMREQYGIGFIDVGGWDTHVNEGGAKGALATNLESLGRGLRTFADTMGTEWHNTVVVVVSEFGRTFRENGNNGTDHGHGSVYWVMGGGLRGGRVAGEQVRVGPSTLFQNRDYPVLNDYRAVCGGLFRSLWGLSREQSERIFPGTAPIDLGLV
jgi:uncharacterized protein (DUF1501 family)